MTELVISFELDGLHYWPNAPEQYSEFRQPHRHLFKFICWYPTGNSQDPTRREKELWELRQDTITAIREEFLHLLHPRTDLHDFSSMSVEGIADWVKDKLGFSKVFVGEDVNFGAVVS